MSRICIKGLPKEASEKELRALVARAIGGTSSADAAEAVRVITDVKVVRTSAGLSRQFAFVGFKGDAEATAAVGRLHRTYLGTSRLHVELARGIGDDPTRTWSRHSKKAAQSPGGTRAGTPAAAPPSAAAAATAAKSDSKNASSAAAASAKGVKDAAKLEEFLALARSRGRSAVWANNDAVSGSIMQRRGVSGFAASKAKDAASAAAAVATAASGVGSDDDGGSTDSGEYQQEVTALDDEDADANDADADAGVHARGHRSATAAGDDDDDDNDDDGEEEAGDASSLPVAARPVSDMDYLRAHIRRSTPAEIDGDGDGFGADDDDDDDAPASSSSSSGVRSNRTRSALRADDESGMQRNAQSAARVPSSSHISIAAAALRTKPPAGRHTADDDDEEDDEDEEDVDAQLPSSDTPAPSATAAAANPTGRPAPLLEPDADVGETGRLFVRNLPFSATEEEVRAHFVPYGPLADVRLPTHPDTGLHRGFALVTFVVPEHAVSALAGSDGHVFQGRLLHVLPGLAEKEKKGRAGGDERGGAHAGGSDGVRQSGFQRERETGRKHDDASGNSGGGASPWSALFTRADTAVSAAADRLGVSASSVLDRDAPNMAVRASLAEAAVIAETKAFLAAEGVHLPTLEAGLQSPSGAASAPSASTASTTVILVKNLPFASTSPATLKDMFSRFGVVARFSLPPSRALALVEFADAKAAKKAFAGLAYARYQRVPLYLQWAPEGVFESRAGGAGVASAFNDAAAVAASGSGGAAAASVAVSSLSLSSPAVASQQQRDDTAMGAAAAAVSAAAAPRTLFVKNLSFATSEEGLRDMLGVATAGGGGGVRSVRIPRRRNPKWRTGEDTAAAATTAAGGKAAAHRAKAEAAAAAAAAAQPEWLSMGYGFVEFDSAEAAGRALRSLQGKSLDGHVLQLSLASARAEAAVAPPPAAAAASQSKRKKKQGGDADEEATAAASTTATSTAATAAAASSAPASSAAPASACNKLIVRNLAFEANKKDLTELFGAFGQVKTVRLPKKFDGSHRGFAFVEFLTHAEAASAMASLSAAHLYGRHLVLEYSTTEPEGSGSGGAGSGGGRGGAHAGVGAGAPRSSRGSGNSAQTGEGQQKRKLPGIESKQQQHAAPASSEDRQPPRAKKAKQQQG